MAIESTEGGGFVVTGEADTRFFRLLSIRGMLRLELKGLTSSRGSVMPILANMGFAPVKNRYSKKDRETALETLNNFIETSIKNRKDQEK